MKKLIFSLALFSLSLNSYAANVDCSVQAKAMADHIKQTNWGTHAIRPEPTVFTTGPVTIGGLPYFQLYVEWVDNTVGGDAIISLLYNPYDCTLAKAEALDI